MTPQEESEVLQKVIDIFNVYSDHCDRSMTKNDCMKFRRILRDWKQEILE